MPRKPKRRGNGEGSIGPRKDGRWWARARDLSGKQVFFYAATRPDVADKLACFLAHRKDTPLPLLQPPAPAVVETVSAYLDRWLLAVEGQLKPRTFAAYEQFVRVHLKPALGAKPLAALSVADVGALYAQRSHAGAKASSVRKLHAILHAALGAAVREGCLPRNVAAQVQPPRVQHTALHTLSPVEVKRLLAAAADDRLEGLYVVALHTGMREGEMLGLHWRDVDLETGTLSVQGTLQRTKRFGLRVDSPKTAGSSRRILLTAQAVAALRRQEERQARERLAAGPRWQASGLVWTSVRGTPLEASNVYNRSWLPLLARAGLPRMRIHDLRHSAATLMLVADVHPKIVSEILGHASIRTTFDLYSHVSVTMQQSAVERLGTLLA